MKISDESKVGIFATVIIIVLITGYNYLRGKNLFSTDSVYYAYYDNSQGIQESNPVILNGHKIGKVDKIKVDEHQNNKILLVFSIKREIVLPLGTIAKVIDKDLLGAKAIELILTDNKKKHENRDTLIGATSISLAESVGDMMNPVVEKINKLIEQVNNIMDESGSKNLKQILENLNSTTQDLNHITNKMNQAKVAERLSKIIANVESISKTLKDNEDNIRIFMENMKSISDSLEASKLAETVNKSYEVLNQVNMITEKINKGEGSLGLLVNDQKLYNNLEETSKNLNKLVDDLEKHPGRYVRFSVFGGKDKKSKEEEKK